MAPPYPYNPLKDVIATMADPANLFRVTRAAQDWARYTYQQRLGELPEPSWYDPKLREPLQAGAIRTLAACLHPHEDTGYEAPVELLSETLVRLFSNAGDYLNDPAATEALLPAGWTTTVVEGDWQGRRWYRVMLTDGKDTVTSDPGAIPRGYWSLARAMIVAVAAVRSGCRIHNQLH